MKEWFLYKFELFEKYLLYFRSSSAYFPPTDFNEIDKAFKEKVSDYPIDFVPLLSGIHWRNFDDYGVPIQFISGKTHYCFSMITSFGKACLQKYLRSNELSYWHKAEIQANYILRHAQKVRNELLLRSFNPTQKSHTGSLSAMCQGQAASFLFRIAKLNNDDELLQKIPNFFGCFERSTEHGGVVSELEPDVIWPEEYPGIPLRHTLNGGLFAIIALNELSPQYPSVARLSQKAMDGLLALLPKFDNGYWSWYHVGAKDSSRYIASMKYHSLHCLQLKIIAEQTGSDEVLHYANQFENYLKRTNNRMRAMGLMAYSKIRKSYR